MELVIYEVVNDFGIDYLGL